MSGSDPTRVRGAAEREFERDITRLRDPSTRGEQTSGRATTSSVLTTGSGKGNTGPMQRVLKSRFVLDQKLGSGGMGTVFRAKDLRKVEARDRFPYVAIKVLNEDFKKHPQAYIALEREASKSQQLSHPNIVSIFDFDKDGDVPFITMELLQGRELADLLHAYPNGLPDEMAWPVIRGLCEGLKYAHDSGVVHADFKPGNVFVTSQNTAKILDFGIARAVRMKLGGGDGEDTAFDPARLAALTPVYASLEMIRGDNPELRDDLYSLSVVIYMILTGHHPYGRLSAEEAHDENLQPERPKRLKQRQWRALLKGLAFHRQQRPANVGDLAEGLFGRRSIGLRAAASIGAALVLTFGAVYMLDGAQIDEVKQEVRQNTLVDAQLARVSELLGKPTFNDVWLNLIERELDILETVDELDVHHSRLRERVVRQFVSEIERSNDFVEAVRLREAASEHARTEATKLALQNAMQGAVSHSISQLLLALPEVDDLSAKRTELERVLAYVAASSAEVPPALVGVLISDAEAALQAHDLQRVGAVLELAELFPGSREEIDRLQSVMAENTTKQRQARARADAQRIQLDLIAELDRLVAEEMSCIRFAPDRLKTFLTRAPDKSSMRTALDARIADCVTALAGVDEVQARALRREAMSQLGSLPAVQSINLDPCGESADGTCTDRLPSGLDLDLVVFAGESGFAVTKLEIQNRAVAIYCAETGRCEGALDRGDLPVTAMQPSTVQAFARWLSAHSGFDYRLPTRAEWQLIAQHQEISPRHCADSPIRSADKGPMDVRGLKNVVGNVRELVAEGDAMWMVGDTKIGPEGECVPMQAVSLQGPVDQRTGFRLVRELS